MRTPSLSALLTFNLLLSPPSPFCLVSLLLNHHPSTPPRISARPLRSVRAAQVSEAPTRVAAAVAAAPSRGSWLLLLLPFAPLFLPFFHQSFLRGSPSIPAGALRVAPLSPASLYLQTPFITRLFTAVSPPPPPHLLLRFLLLLRLSTPLLTVNIPSPE